MNRTLLIRAYRNRASACALALTALATIAAPLLADSFELFDASAYAALALYALSLGLVWGYGGMLCFGQSVFFGLAAYAYAVAGINLGDSTPAILIALTVTAGFAALLGYFLIYGRLNDVYFAVTTLTVTLITFNLVNSTSGPEYRIGAAPLGGFNGISGVPGFNLPWDAAARAGPVGTYLISVIVLAVAYFAARLLIASAFGRILIATRENAGRAELLGYDVRAYKLATFVLGATLAAIAGCLYANWSGYVSPTMFGLSMAAQPLIWILVGGLGTLGGPIVGTFAIQYAVTALGIQSTLHPQIVLGGLMLVFVLFVPAGLTPFLGKCVDALLPATLRQMRPGGLKAGAS